MNMGQVTYYVTNFVSELALNGLEDVVISPGSRSTPLAMTFFEHPHIKEWVHFDERSSAFFALGLAKEKNKPVALVCTSGTAAANYYPAIVEAYYARVPLIVLTADRPHELRDNGAPQAIDQIKMYENFTKYFHEMALPESKEEMIRYARIQASRAYMNANSNRKGVSHLNFPFRDPLIPNFELDNLWGEAKEPILKHINGDEQILPHDVLSIVQSLKNKERGLIVCGEILDEAEQLAILNLSKELNIPILADVISNLRKNKASHPLVISTYDTILKDDLLKEQLRPDFIIRFGSMPVSKSYLQSLQSYPPSLHIVVDNDLGYREPAGINTTLIYSSAESFGKELLKYKPSIDVLEDYTNLWLKMDAAVQNVLKTNEVELTEGTAALALSEASVDGDVLVVGSSMPIRDMDTFYLRSNRDVKLMANRGVNGIDGVVSTAIGIRAAGRKTTLLIGDLSFLHDYTSLFIARQYELSLRIIVINNNGGGIFSFLPQAKEKRQFEALFGTPFSPPIKQLTQAIDATYYEPKTFNEFSDLIQKPIEGIEIIEVITDREENVLWHREKWDQSLREIKKER